MASQFDYDVYRWKQHGQLSIWRYLDLGKRSLDWHMAADLDGLSSLESLFRAFQGFDGSVYRSLAIAPPTDSVLAVPSFPEREVLTPEKLRVSYDPSFEAGWSLPLEGEPLLWRIGPSGLSQVLEFLDDPDAFFDVSIGRNPPVWWWGTHGFSA
ncbi:MAG: hypothetical protein AAFN07_12830 [Pseudomonadota bacterium]